MARTGLCKPIPVRITCRLLIVIVLSPRPKITTDRTTTGKEVCILKLKGDVQTLDDVKIVGHEQRHYTRQYVLYYVCQLQIVVALVKGALQQLLHTH